MYDLKTADFAVIDRLRRETTETLVRELLTEFCDGLRGRIDQCRSALKVDDYTLIARNAHILKSEAWTFGAMHLGNSFQRLETAGAKGESAEAMHEILHETSTLADAYITAISEAQF